MPDAVASPRDAPWEKKDSAPSPAPGDDNPRWPGAPEQKWRDGVCTNAHFTCSSCGEPSTLCYRCSECGAPGSGSSGEAGTGERT